MTSRPLRIVTAPHDGPSGVDGGGHGGDDGSMEARLTALETKLQTILPTLATKADLAELGLAAKADMAELRADMHKVDSSIKTWTLATMITIIGTMLAAIFGVSQIFKTASAPSAQPAQAPIIINVPPAAPTPPTPKQ